MGFSTFVLTIFLVVMTSGFNYGHFFLAGFPGWPTGDSPFTGYQSPMLTSLRFGPISMPTPGIPKFPTIPAPTFLYPFPTIPTFQSIQDMIKTMPNKGGSYSGVVVSTQTESKMKDDGTLVKKGGSTILINDDGKVTVHTTGDNPPDISDKAAFKPIPPFKFKSMYDSFDKFKNYDEYHNYPNVKPIDFDSIKTHQPGPGETFQAHAITSNRYSSNINGQVSQGGHIATIQNNNGEIKEESYTF
ncbi:uncharacterized protein LOC118273898 isoform X1 [Spodoptera frugiperda]|uniref:Uncharacterized protein LOC118273898 isoform X1 n=1 Tax=Spodoptera frugiperda TaxID=7108 RepID=A0A9R0DWJ5_SPOFR|nr:uncharacterized protein LOC118273898 isoform X1 [Spodoptera frugiperda]XP_050554976.1 uncharacterized protein LOC118273898 isoform X1 [Spodoptera frugiperda]XP_050554977.1 uncharacterized protein LOC118273898 isoform X1 [Spodoptera frugiperda]XP_050554978.1 uncharacterized protein LOC118273898 isoform X1 [Spodoptera frugiperda]XP_050554979.1 uncharacterized protein LOC118273898 isoform X1 [Spodoptera frugiperda]